MAMPPPPSGPATLDESTRVAIAPIDYSDVIPHHTRAAVRAPVGDTLREIARDSLLLDVDAECRPRECALRQARDAEAEFLLDMRVTLADRDYAIAIVVLAADDGRELARADGLCRLCAQAELLAEIATQLATLEATLGPEPVEPPVVPNRTFDRLDHATTPRPGMKIAGWRPGCRLHHRLPRRRRDHHGHRGRIAARP